MIATGVGRHLEDTWGRASPRINVVKSWRELWPLKHLHNQIVGATDLLDTHDAPRTDLIWKEPGLSDGDLSR